MANMDLGAGAGAIQADGPGPFSTLFNWLGAFMSLALIGGLGVWGYQLAMRDVSGVPVVRALEGPMRIMPEDPGGMRAANQGLAVNSVAAEGGAEAPADRLILAPEPLDLAAEDLPQSQLAGARPAQPSPAEPAPAEPEATREVVLAKALSDGNALAQNVVPLSATIKSPEPIAKIIPASVRGVVSSPVPRPRPIGDVTAEAVANSVALAVGAAVGTAAGAAELDPSAVPVGTRLVQFGAFDTPEAARAEWVKLDNRFSDFLRDKTRVVQQAVSGGKTFWRLRAMGFEDINDARRFCSALLAERQACIPVVVR